MGRVPAQASGAAGAAGAAGGVLAPEAPEGAELWIGSGRQHQVYVRRDEEGVLRLSPGIWSTLGKRWLSMDLYQRGGPDMALAGCFNCHLSFVSYVAGDRGVVPGWTELPVGCESCHGPGLDHVKARQAGRDDDYGGTEGLGAAEEARLCGRCHGNREDLREAPVAGPEGGPAGGAVRAFHRTLVDRFLRPDGTQRLTGYQLGGHLMSACHRVGKAQCRHCHDPHTGKARALDGASAEGAGSDRQCTACHRDQLDHKAAKRHAKHPEKALRCVDCHMSNSWIGDTPDRDQRTSDHGISVPRPDEAGELGLPNACATCHEGRRGGRAGERRSWVHTVARARGSWADAAGPLVALLQDRTAGAFGQASALDLMAGLARNPTLAQAVEAGGFHEAADPLVRSHALAALIVHSPKGQAHWVRRGLDDPHAVVRMRCFDRAQVQMLTEPDLQRHLDDALQWRQRPKMRDLMQLAEIRMARGEFAHATAVLDLADRLASPDERKDPGRRALADRARRMSAGGVGDRPWAQ